ncbi:MAG TPA: glycine zipper 2TM domain-containing protein [Pseudoxanthomonas sp.]|uniref:glycine zipper 2TM domain-containing protein n=1 Tax=Pseudoxanthomonas sp. SE1 TaxID=1664560 RepID=UPI00240E46BF|nr:glycine zipper 2TM domain-containing protein [Pseudoxanthomonas sp. SE1]WFC40576.1 glycine zipper 2TM domain-containing protein [Pseudoxanthomonas sp. SE1]HJS35504.1 glycine zipper 2TM domain-containing protein [Pseudoxanthomonas sp.]
MNMRFIAIGLTATVALAGCASTSPGYGNSGYGGGYNSAPASRYCADCGIVERIDVVSSGRSAPSATGAVLGGIVGAVAGRQISDRTGGSEGNKNVSTVAGAVAGAAAGNAIQNRTTGDTYNVTVRMDDGRRVTISQRDLGGIRENTYVRIQNGRVVLR